MTASFVPATPGHTETVPRRRTAAGWADRGKVSETVQDHRRHLTVGVAIAVVLTAADAVLLTTVANILIASQAWKSWLLVLGMCVALVATAVLAGQQLRYAVATGRTIHWVFTGSLLTAWIALGVLLMIVRWNSGALENTTVTYEDGGVLADDGGTSPHIWLAVLLLGLHIVIGAVAVLDGYWLTNPVAAELRRVRSQLAMVEHELSAAEADFVRVAELRRIAQGEEKRIDVDLVKARQHADAVFEQLQDSVRLHIAALLGDPGATGGARRRPVPVRS